MPLSALARRREPDVLVTAGSDRRPNLPHRHPIAQEHGPLCPGRGAGQWLGHRSARGATRSWWRTVS